MLQCVRKGFGTKYNNLQEITDMLLKHFCVTDMKGLAKSLDRKMKYALELLRNNEKVKDVAEQIGYSD